MATGATADFTARNEVQVNTEFNAQQGSETHIYCSPYVFNDCSDDFTNYNRVCNVSASNFESEQKEIEVNFNTEINSFNVYPNPNSGIFIVEVNDKERLSHILQLSDAMGKIQKIILMENSRMQVNWSDFAKGIYFLRYQNINRKIIIN